MTAMETGACMLLWRLAFLIHRFLHVVADGGDLGLGDGLIIPEMGFADDAVSDHGDADLVF